MILIIDILLTFYPERPSIELEGAASAKDGKYIPLSSSITRVILFFN
jgi:hypothetical protein